METMWLVKKVTETTDERTAFLVRGTWFKSNPAYTEMMDEYEELIRDEGQSEADRIVNERDKDRPFIEEFLPAMPGEEDAMFDEAGESLWLDVTNWTDYEVKPGDTVTMSLGVTTHSVCSTRSGRLSALPRGWATVSGETDA